MRPFDRGAADLGNTHGGYFSGLKTSNSLTVLAVHAAGRQP